MANLADVIYLNGKITTLDAHVRRFRALPCGMA